MEWRLWLLIILTFETATEGAVANPPILVEAQRTQRLQKPMYEDAIHQPLIAEESFVPPGTDIRNLNHGPEVMVGLVFHSLNPKYETERSYVRVPLRQRLRPGTQSNLLFPFCAVS